MTELGKSLQEWWDSDACKQLQKETEEAKQRAVGKYFMLSEEDKLAVSRARKIQKFLSQPFNVAEQFTGSPGKYVTLAETVRGFKEILEGKHDDKPEQAFYMKGGIDEVTA